jgi:hypothetical protein
MTKEADRELRDKAAARYKPEHVRLLLIAEAPPSAIDRYFYFPDVASQDSLFRHVAGGVLGLAPTRTNKRELLAKLRDSGVFLIDLCRELILDKIELGLCASGLVHRALALSPEHIILIKADVYDVSFHRLTESGLPVIDARIPFPGSGHQRRFAYLFNKALRDIGWARAA